MIVEYVSGGVYVIGLLVILAGAVAAVGTLLAISARLLMRRAGELRMARKSVDDEVSALSASSRELAACRFFMLREESWAGAERTAEPCPTSDTDCC